MENSINTEQIALMTGATSGFGTVVAKHLVRKNYKLVFFARSENKANELISDLEKDHPNANVDYILCDLSSLESIVEACKMAHEKCKQIDLLILNAGLWNFEFQETKNGIEETFQVNLLAPVLMFQKLKDLISKNDRSKVIITASGLHQGEIQFDDIEFKKDFSGFKAYRQSKLGVILMTRLFAKLPEYSGISFYSVHPGLVRTQLGKKAGWFSRFIFRLIGTSIDRGARTHIHLIDQPAKDLVSGEYYAKSKVTKATKESNDLQEASELFNTIRAYLDSYL